MYHDDFRTERSRSYVCRSYDNLYPIVSVMDEKRFCLGQKRVDEKTNEIKAIPKLLDCLNIKGTIITTDAMGTWM